MLQHEETSIGVLCLVGLACRRYVVHCDVRIAPLFVDVGMWVRCFAYSNLRV